MNLSLTADKLCIQLTGQERFWAFHWSESIEVSLEHIKRVRAEAPQPNLFGIRAPGTYLPGILKAGTYYTKRGREFWYVNSDRYLTLELNQNEYYKRIVLSLENHQDWAAQISQSRPALQPQCSPFTANHVLFRTV